MTGQGALEALTVQRLARDLNTGAGQPMPALRCYESLAALWIRCCDTGLPGANVLRDKTLRAARRLAAGEDTVVAPDPESIPTHLTRDASLVRLPAALAVQGVEWPDAIALAETWLDGRTWDGPVLVAGVRTGGAYLAPLVAARLEAAGVDTRLAAVRRGEELCAGDRRVLLVDDPPLTGSTLLALAREETAPGGVEVLVPVFETGDVQGLREAGIAVTVLEREQWQSTRRLQPDSLPAYLAAHAHWPGTHGPYTVAGLVDGRENSVLAPWPGVRRRSPGRAAVRLLGADGIRPAVAGWVPPGIFGDAARAVATAVRSPVPPAIFAVAPALVLGEDLLSADPGGARPGPEHLDEAVGYVLDRARQLPVRSPAGGPVPEVLHGVARALTGGDNEAAALRLHRLVSAFAPSLPDNRCEAEKWFLDDGGRLRKTGHLTHAYRRDNELLNPLIDLAALTVAFGSGLEAVAESIGRRLPDGRPWHTPLAVALLAYGTARGGQLPRTYNPQRAAETAVEAYRLQRAMTEAARLVQHLLHHAAPGRPPTREAGREPGPRIGHLWHRPPEALVQPRLTFGGAPAPDGGPGPTAEETVLAQNAITRWAGDRFLPVREGNTLLLAPLGLPASWPDADGALVELEQLLPRPGLLAWCGVPCVALSEAG
ncbi:hypothetical protein ACIBEA_39635 [Streptomyces sp. NPDC051555]|uniref:hypothetical protein n=1 Tax=Streptomyces sp. NPDC051555 TaxID=3365657 RepID=UPI00379B49FD